ncbi:methyltransferase domain-containing protein [Prosthecochloris sp.]|uniref:class I SAM-dependent methyltransferase n=1 Tax=Prosthecochloris sp. TaxID=290513 RepID=UPI0025D484BE|nr:methyltransferase domain-containing protein [Prosthecochloris sp.]
MRKSSGASIEFSLIWESECAVHRERRLVSRVNFWRDIFPGRMGEAVEALHPGGRCRESFSAGRLVVPSATDGIVRFKEKCFEHQQEYHTLLPKIGRFYPQGFAWTAFGCFRGNMNPFRVIGIENETLIADTSHPLAQYPVSLEATCVEKREAFEERGGMCHDISEAVTSDGPGMQVPYPGIGTDFYSEYPFRRQNESADGIFYSIPRFIDHLDVTALNHIGEIYSRTLVAGSKILDLMSSWVSHLPDELEQCEVVGLGMNEEELAANERLCRYVVHDLNESPSLPFADNEFDAVICTASVEYLVRPLEVFEDIGRIVRQGGLCVVTFSDRWFPGKQILPWSELHGFERMGLVLDFFLTTGRFENLHTETVRGYLRSSGDRYGTRTAFSDPVFAVWGSVNGK